MVGGSAPPATPPVRDGRWGVKGLSRAGIATQALQLIDDVGLNGFSMRKLGNALGVDAMSVYHYFDNQEDLYDGVAEAIFAEIDVDALPWQDGWRAASSSYATALREVLLAHPHAVTIFATRPLRSEAALAVGMQMLGVMAQDQIPGPEALRAARCLNEYVTGHAMGLTSANAAAVRSRKPEPGSDRYNTLAAAADASRRDDHFELGLDAFLDGLQTRFSRG